MAAPSTPTNFYLQQGNGQCLVSCDLTSTATTYPVYRSSNGITFSNVASPAVPYYLDSTVTVGTLYYYYMTAANSDGASSATSTLSIVPSNTAVLALGQVRAWAMAEADMVNSKFLSVPEWNFNISQSYFELYDILVTNYEDYYMKATPQTITTDGSNNQFALATDFYKLLGVDLGLSGSSNAWVTVKKFNFISRNRYVYPQLTSSYLGVFNLRYRVMGSNIMFIPTPSGGQYIRLWYIPRLTQPLQDTDMLDGVSGWTEYVIVDAAIKAADKEESDTSRLQLRKDRLIKRIEETAMNRDAGEPDTISDTRSMAEQWGGYGSPNGDGSYGGY